MTGGPVPPEGVGQRVVGGSDGPGDRRGTTRAGDTAGGGVRVIADRYELFEQLGRGGMGTVWRAHDRLLARDVAAKELHVFTQGDEEHQTWLRRALREARVVARVPHPHVVGVHDLVDYEGRLWIVMELVEGPSLAQLVEQQGALDPERVAFLGVQLLGALDAVHAVGALHRDVKPPNVLLRRDGSAVLTDFGIAALDDGEFLTKPGEVAGSAEYMAPERVTSGDVGPASDLWSLGATLATAATGQSPFRRHGQAATLHAVAYEEPALDDRLGPLRPVVEALLRKAPEERPSVADAMAALRHAAGGTGGVYALPPAPAGSQPAGSQSAVTQPVVSSGAPADARTVVDHSFQGPDPAAATQLYDADTMSALTRQDGRQPAPRGTRGRRRWAVAAGAAVLAGAGAGLFLTGTPPFGSDTARAGTPGPSSSGGSEETETEGAGTGPSVGADSSREPSAPDTAPDGPAPTELAVVSRQGWQPAAEVTIKQDDTVTVRYLRGEWTVDRRNVPSAGPEGYDAATDGSLDFAAEDCKIAPAVPFAALLGRFSVGDQENQKSAARVVGDEWVFKAPADGQLELSINDGKDGKAADGGDGGCLSDNEGELTVAVTVAH